VDPDFKEREVEVMKTAIVSLALVVLVAAGFLFLHSARAFEARQGAQLAALEAEINLLRESQAREAEGSKRLQARVAKLEAAAAAPARSSPGARASSQASKAGPAGTAEKAGIESPAENPAADDSAREASLAEAMEKLADPRLSREDRNETWSELRKAGLLDDAVAAFEARVKDDPQNPDRHAELGNAYIQKILAAGDAEKSRWAMKADGAFDQALALDDHHWEARFQKAASLSYWPPLFGKQAEAMKHFEVLREQQEAGPPQPKFAATYLLLGNLYQNGNNLEKAREVWKKGAELFPGDQEIAKKVEASKEN
jgi:tetratricopeptide (TPR) repeat protein